MSPFWDSWFEGIANWITQNGWNQRPTSAIFIVLVSIFISIISTSATRLITDVDALKETMIKVNEWNQKKKQAMAKADKKLWLKVKRDEERIKKLQSSMMMKRMKPMLITTVPFLIIFAIVRTAFSGHYYAWLPFNMGGFPFVGNPWFAPTSISSGEPEGFSKATFTLWYFMVSFAFGSLISRIFGANPSGAAKMKQKQTQSQLSSNNKSPTSKQKKSIK